MSSNTVVENTGNQAIINTDLSKIFIWGNRYDKADYTNSTYDTVTLVAGTVMGRIGATQEIVPLDSAATDGSQYPVGILAQDAVVEDGDTVSLAFCDKGDVAQEKVVLTNGTDTLETLLADDRSIADHIKGDTAGIKLIVTNELTGYDNQ